MKKNTKIIIAATIAITFIIGNMVIKNTDREFAGLLSYHWLNEDNKESSAVSIDLDEGYSEDDLNYLGSIATKKRNDELSASESKDLGIPTHHMMVYISKKSTKITYEKPQFNLWIYKDRGYIQSIKDEDITNTEPQYLNGISKLDNDEYEFITKALLKYYSSDTIFNK